MRLLLTSGGIKNPSIQDALVEVLGKPIAEASALCISTASYALIRGPELAYQYFTGTSGTPMCELGWKAVGVLELTALPSVDKERWVASVRNADVLLVHSPQDKARRMSRINVFKFALPSINDPGNHRHKMSRR